MQPNKVIILWFFKNRINHCDKVRVLRPSGYYASPHAALREIRVWDLWSRPFLLIWILSSSTWCDPSFECGISRVCNRAVRFRFVCLLKSFLKRSLFPPKIQSASLFPANRPIVEFIWRLKFSTSVGRFSLDRQKRWKYYSNQSNERKYLYEHQKRIFCPTSQCFS